jgi:hypothetical protein
LSTLAVERRISRASAARQLSPKMASTPTRPMPIPSANRAGICSPSSSTRIVAAEMDDTEENAVVRTATTCALWSYLTENDRDAFPFATPLLVATFSLAVAVPTADDALVTSNVMVQTPFESAVTSSGESELPSTYLIVR